jgi:hypothetical protein
VNRHLRLVVRIALVLLASSFVFGAAYHWVMFGSSPTRDSLIETLNYSFQTITTVGYGNWVPAGWDVKETDLQNRILYVKAISVGILSNLLSHR